MPGQMRSLGAPSSPDISSSMLASAGQGRAGAAGRQGKARASARHSEMLLGMDRAAQKCVTALTTQNTRHLQPASCTLHPPVLPGKRGSFFSSSAKMQPQLHMSMASVYCSAPSSTSGALRQYTHNGGSTTLVEWL